MKINITLFSVLLCIVAGCNRKALDQAASAEQASLIYGEWHGTLPCADCTSIDYFLKVNEDGTYEEQAYYTGKSSTPQLQAGTWKFSRDSVLVLEKENPGHSQFLFTGGNLEMLDIGGKRIKSGFPDHYILRKGPSEFNPNRWEAKREAGVDFIAMGNEPFWSLEIDFDKSMKFASLNGFDTINTPVPEGVELQDENGTSYLAETEAGALEVTIYGKPCNDTMSGEAFPYTVAVEATGNNMKETGQFSGCGKYLQAMRPNGLWVLQEINNEPIKQENFARGVPTIEFNLKENKVYGHGGCNRYSGSMAIEGNKISFMALISTKMACPNLDVEQKLFNALSNKTLSFNIENGVLVLQDDVVTLKFKKAD